MEEKLKDNQMVEIFPNLEDSGFDNNDESADKNLKIILTI